MYRKLVTDISWLGGVSALIKPLWMLFLVSLVPSVLGDAGYGIFNTALALVALTIAFSDWGMAQYTLREVARRPTRSSRFFSNLILLRLALLVLAYAVTMLVAVGLGYDREALYTVAAAGVYWGAETMLQYARMYYRAHQRLRVEAVSTALEKGAVMACGGLGLYATASAWGTLAAMAVAMIAVLAGNLWWIHRHVAAWRRRVISPAFIRKTVPRMIPLGIAGLFTVYYMRTDQVMVEAMLGPAEAGLYGHAFRLLVALNIVPIIVVQGALFPRLSALYHEKALAVFQTLLRRSALALLAIGVVVSATLYATADLLIALLVRDPAFAAAAPVLQVLCWTFPFTILNQLGYVTLISMDENVFPIKVLALVTVFNIAFNAMLIPRFGIEGAAAVTVLSEVLIVVAYVARYQWTTRARLSSSTDR
ncbi:MAG: flippase [Bacteroidota bacterium]